MIVLPRRKLLTATAGLLAMPAIVRSAEAWFPRGAAAGCPAPGAAACGTTTGDAFLNNALFVPYVKFFGEPSNGATQVGQAYSGPLILTPPWFAIGFEVCLDFINFGAFFSYSNQAYGSGLPLALHQHGMAVFNHFGGPETIPCAGPNIFCSSSQADNINQWSCVCYYAPDATGAGHNIILDGVTGTNSGTGLAGYPQSVYGTPPNTANPVISFGSWVPPIRGSANDPDCLNGGLRNWAVVQGNPPTHTEYETFRNGGDPRAIWGVSTPSGSPIAYPPTQTWTNGVVAYYAFTSDPRAASASAASATATFGGTTMTVSAVGSGALIVGGVLSGPGVIDGTRIVRLGTATGGVGTYIVNFSQSIASPITVTQSGSGGTSISTTGATEPDLSGNGNTLFYANGSSDPNGVLPQLMTCSV